MALMTVPLVSNVRSKQVTGIKVHVKGAGIRMKKDKPHVKNVLLVEYVQLGPFHSPKLNLICAHQDIIALVVRAKLSLAIPLQNTTGTWIAIAKKTLLNVKLVTSVQKDRVNSKNVYRVLLQTVLLWLHVTTVMLVTTVPPLTT